MDFGGTLIPIPKTEKVKASIRSAILDGTYRPSRRLPTFAEMESDFAVGRAVIQQAVEALKRDGFIRSESGRGLFVTENPPHLYQYGLVMSGSPESGWDHLTTALNKEALLIEQNDPQHGFRFYYGMRAGADEPLRQLRDDIDSHRLAGLVVDPVAATVLDSALAPGSGPPRVYLWADEHTGMTPCLTVDGSQLLERSLNYLKERGRKRVALLQISNTNNYMDFRKLFADAGMEHHHPWIQSVGRNDPASTESLIALLMDYRFDVRPDGLIIADDNLVPAVSRGLLRAGVKVGDELELVAHCNWPWPPQSVLPMTRIGFDVREVLQRAIRTISQLQAGETPEPYQRVRAQFEWETHGKS